MSAIGSAAQEGFTLIEVMVTAGLLAIGLLAAMSFNGTTDQQWTNNFRQVQALEVGTCFLEDLMGRYSGDLSLVPSATPYTLPAPTTAIDAFCVYPQAPSALAIFTPTWTVTQQSGLILKIQLTISWSDANGVGQHSINFTTYRSSE